MKKNDSIQILRAIAALLVVYLHAVFTVSFHTAPRQMTLVNFARFGACGVDIFFAISGFILSTLAMKMRADRSGFHNGWDFLLRRFIRIFPIYWLLSLFFVLVGAKQHYLTTSWLINSYLLLPSLQYPMQVPLILVGWTLIFEMFFYYLITLNLFFGVRHIVGRTILTILVLICLGALIGFRQPILILVANPMNLEFVFGCLVGLAYVRFGKRQSLGTTLLIVGSAMLIATLTPGLPGLSDNKSVLNGTLSWTRVIVWGLPSAMITAGLVFRSTPIRSALGRLAVSLGDASYSIYLISPIVFYGYNRIYHLLAALGPEINVALAFLLVVLCGWLCYRYVESPMIRSLNARDHRSSAQLAP
jgi:exopolysaccharide production protein ExoZ